MSREHHAYRHDQSTPKQQPQQQQQSSTTRPHSQENGSHGPSKRTGDSSLSAILASHLHRDHHPQSMDGRQAEYSQPGLNSPYASYQHAHSSERSSPDSASAVQYQQGQQDYKSNNNFSSSGTPESGYGLPQSARSSNFPEYIQRSYGEPSQNRYPASAQGNMAQTSSPSHPMANGHRPNGHAPPSNHVKSDADVPIDPSIAQSSPTYPPPHNYSPYPQHDMQQYPQQPMTSYGRPEWAGQYGQTMGYHSPAATGGAAPNMVGGQMSRPAAGGHPLSTVYSFVPIPGAQQHKRPRRRYEEIERMYKCGWNGCEKAYGTLNHLNAHVTMQSHGTKRTPEEFKEIRKEWKQRKKDEENQRKADEERQRQDAARSGQDNPQAAGPPGHYGGQMMPQQMGGPQLPPIGYQAAGGQAPGQYGQPQQVDGAPQYGGNSQMYGGQAYPQSPYGQSGIAYQQRA